MEKSCETCGRVECANVGLNIGGHCGLWQLKQQEKVKIPCKTWIPKWESWTPVSKIAGVGKDAETTINEKGGKQSKVLYAFDALDPQSMFNMCRVLKEGRDKYGSDENWRRIPCNEHLNHLLIHVFAYLAGDRQDEHLEHALCRAMFALGVELDKDAAK